jgi:type II secretory ATPase GspE/PulE/Tfp pilus assembly ATPase PilB-like protein
VQAKDKDKAGQLRDMITERIVPKLDTFLKAKVVASREREAKKEEMISKMQDETTEEAATEEASQIPLEPVEDILKFYVQNYKGHDIYELSIR